MTQSIVDELTVWAAEGRALDEFVGAATFKAFLNSETVQSRIDRFADTTYRSNETASFYSGDKQVPVERNEEWAIYLSTSSKGADHFYTHSGPTIITYIHGDDSVYLDTYEIPAPLDDVAAVRRATAVSKGRVELWPLDSWVGNNPALTCIRSEPRPGAIFMRITGPTRVPYIHAFRRADLTYSYSAFADHLLTGRDFMSKFLKSLLSDESFAANMTSAERHRSGQMINAMLTDEMFAPSSEWAMIQALSTIAPDEADIHLSRIVQSNGVLAPHARAALQEQSS